MFTLQQIHDAHAQVKSGADFPRYMQDLITLGITSFETFVFDNHTQYCGKDGFTIGSEGFTETLTLNGKYNGDQFKADLKSHQLGNTDYLTFLRDCAKSGIEKWIVLMDKMTCTYYDVLGNAVLVESIPLE